MTTHWLAPMLWSDDKRTSRFGANVSYFAFKKKKNKWKNQKQNPITQRVDGRLLFTCNSQLVFVSLLFFFFFGFLSWKRKYSNCHVERVQHKHKTPTQTHEIASKFAICRRSANGCLCVIRPNAKNWWTQWMRPMAFRIRCHREYHHVMLFALWNLFGRTWFTLLTCFSFELKHDTNPSAFHPTNTLSFKIGIESAIRFQNFSINSDEHKMYRLQNDGR